MLDLLTSTSGPRVKTRSASIGIRLTPSSTIELLSPPWLRKIDRRISDLMSLAPGWDGEGSVPVSCETALGAWQFVLSHVAHETPEPQIVPTSSGGLQFEWHLLGITLELRFDPNEEASFYYECAGEHELEGSIGDDLNLVGSLVRGLPARDEFGSCVR